MKTGSGKVPVYSVYDEDGSLAMRGTSKEVAEKFDVEQDTITMAARKGTKFLRQYKIVKEASETRQEMIERQAMIKKLYEQGVDTFGISRQMNMSRATAEKYIHQMKAEGVIA